MISFALFGNVEEEQRQKITTAIETNKVSPKISFDMAICDLPGCQVTKIQLHFPKSDKVFWKNYVSEQVKEDKKKILQSLMTIQKKVILSLTNQLP